MTTPDNDELQRMRTLLGEMQARVAEEQAAVVTLRASLEATRSQLTGVHTSVSWKMTRPLRAARDFVSGLVPFMREMRGFPRRARYTMKTRGAAALLEDIRSELLMRLRRGSLAAPPPPLPSTLAAAMVPYAARADRGERQQLHLVRSERPVASIVVPVFNAFDRTYACLASILERTGSIPYEVIVSDDASTDETRDIERLVTGVRVVRSETNRGFLETCNAGARAALGDYIVFLNNDTFVSQGWLKSLLEPFETHGSAAGGVGLVGAKLIYPDGRLQEAGGIVFSDASGWNYGRGDDPGHPRYEFQCDAHYCSGACIAVPRALFDEVGGFDMRFAPMYYEDVDLAFAVRAAGRRVVYQPSCLIVHFEGGTAGTDTGSGAKRYQVVNQDTFRQKWARELREQPAPRSNPDFARYRPTGPHVLIIDSYTPRPDRDAGSVRMFEMCRILRRVGCHVTFVAENRAHDGDYARALQTVGVEMLYHPYLPSIEQHLREFGDRYRAVILSRVDVAREFVPLVKRHCPNALRVFDTVDLHFLRETRRAQVASDLAVSQADRLKQQELGVARACDVTVVVSSVERELLAREARDLQVELVSLIVTPDRTEPAFSERQGMLYVANFHHPPNGDALEDYLRNIHQLVLSRLPDMRLTVIGAHVPERLQRMASDSVRFAGPVADLRPMFAGARLSIAPLRYGAGIKGKVMTSLAYGVPAVTTTIGAEGMEVRHGEDILIADTPDAFAAAVVSLHSDEQLWTRLARQGFEAVAAQFSVANAERGLRRILARAGGLSDAALPAQPDRERSAVASN